MKLTNWNGGDAENFSNLILISLESRKYQLEEFKLLLYGPLQKRLMVLNSLKESTKESLIKFSKYQGFGHTQSCRLYETMRLMN